MEVFLELMTHGHCDSVQNGTINTRDYDAKHWALTQSRVKGQFCVQLLRLKVKGHNIYIPPLT